MRKLISLILILMLTACSDNSQDSVVTEMAAIDVAEISEIPEYIPGHYNQEEKYWESSEQFYVTSPMSDSEYSQLSRYDAEGNSLGMGIVNQEGKVIVSPIYDAMFVGFTDGVCKVAQTDESGKDKWGLVNEQGEEIVSPQYDHISPEAAKDGLLAVGIGELVGYIDLTGKIVIPVEYASTQIAGDGMIAVMKEPQKWGYINYQNELIIPMQFWSPVPFENGKAIGLQKDDGEFTAHINGKIEQTSKW